MDEQTVQRVRRLIDTMTQAHDSQVMTTHAELVCHLPVEGYGTIEFDMTAARMNVLIAAGRNRKQARFELIPIIPVPPPPAAAGPTWRGRRPDRGC